MARTPKPFFSLVAVLMAAIMLCTSACVTKSNQEITMEVVYESQLETEIDSLNRERSSAYLHDLTDWEWDQVSVFFEGDESQLVIDEVGSLGTITSGERINAARGNLLVFQLDGKVTQIIGTLQKWVFPDTSGRRSYTGDVELVPYPSGGGLEIRDADSPPR
jgi:hypothetical protein